MALVNRPNPNPDVYVDVVNSSLEPLADKGYITKYQKQIFDYYRNYFYLNGYYPKTSEVARFFGITSSTIQRHYCEMMIAGLLVYDDRTKAPPVLLEFMTGMSRVPFKGEVTEDGIRTTKESLVNFYDLINTSDFVSYRMMTNLKFPYYRIGDYLIICPATEFEDGVDVLGITNGKTMIGRYLRRPHDCVIVDYLDGESKPINDIVILGEIIGSIRMNTPLEKMFLRSRIKVLGNSDARFKEDILKDIEEYEQGRKV